MQPIILIKIGGSLFTDKNKYKSVKEKALDTICSEIKKATKLGKKLIIAHGQGSFAHYPAKQYQTHKGIINEQSEKGIAEVADIACLPNRLIVRKLIDVGVNAVTVSAFSMMTASNHKLKSVFTQSIEETLKHNLIPVLYGDQILDDQVGCTIFSAEKVLGYLGLELKKKNYQIERIIHCGLTDGVYDEGGETITLIDSSNFDKYKKALGGSHGVDVTGGMLHKVEETLDLAKKGIPGLIIDGIEHGSLSQAIAGKKVLGTIIEK